MWKNLCLEDTFFAWQDPRGWFRADANLNLISEIDTWFSSLMTLPVSLDILGVLLFVTGKILQLVSSFFGLSANMKGLSDWSIG